MQKIFLNSYSKVIFNFQNLNNNKKKKKKYPNAPFKGYQVSFFLLIIMVGGMYHVQKHYRQKLKTHNNKKLYAEEEKLQSPIPYS